MTPTPEDVRLAREQMTGYLGPRITLGIDEDLVQAQAGYLAEVRQSERERAKRIVQECFDDPSGFPARLETEIIKALSEGD